LNRRCSVRLYDRAVNMARAAGIILAAGKGTRFGGNKLLAELDGRPLLQHVLDLAAEVGLAPVVVVLGADADAIARSISWREEVCAANVDPNRGLSSSVQLALAELRRTAPACDRAIVLLGDQPRLTSGQLRVLLSAPPDPARPIIVPRYADGRAGSPVVIDRGAWALAAQLEGDRGMSQLFASRAHMVRYVDVPGINPDVDTREDLVALS
jgi:molybdenum cofactor cytidylyltransferase